MKTSITPAVRVAFWLSALIASSLQSTSKEPDMRPGSFFEFDKVNSLFLLELLLK